MWKMVPQDELIQKPNFQPFYQPEWTAQINVNNGNANIEPSGNFVSIWFNGRGRIQKLLNYIRSLIRFMI